MKCSKILQNEFKMSNLPNNYFELNAIYAFQLGIDSSKDVKKKTLMITKNIIFYRKKMCLMFKSNLFCAAYCCCITGQITFSHLYKGRGPYLTQFELLHMCCARKKSCMSSTSDAFCITFVEGKGRIVDL